MVANRFSIFAIATILISGCTPQTPTGSISGKIIRNGKPVYPVVLLLKDGSGKSHTANVKSQNGEFSIFGIEKGSKFSVAIEAINLPGISQEAREKAAKDNEKAAAVAAAEGRDLRREETTPSQFQNAQIDFPKKYTSFDTSELWIDCTNEIPAEPIVLDLK